MGEQIINEHMFWSWRIILLIILRDSMFGDYEMICSRNPGNFRITQKSLVEQALRH